MQFNFSIPDDTGNALTFSLDFGQYIFVLGANGTGKSSLMYKLYHQNLSTAHRISAHRQTWFTSSTVTLSPEQKRNTSNNIKSSDSSAQSRWKDDYAPHRANIAIYDLVNAENVRARSIASAVDLNNLELAKALSKHDAPIKIINELLQLSNIPIEIIIQENEQVLASKNGSPYYNVAELSDGERNVLLIAANVLTVAPGTLILIDEPERHLHRSIISPLLTQLFANRSDCAFIVSTHDVMLPLDNPKSQTLLIRGCAYQGSDVTSWDADLIPTESQIDETLKKDILGSRRKLLFIEGDEKSLDYPLYSLVFPNVSVIAKTSCRDVDHAVSGIRGAEDLHWLKAFGIIDNDRRTPDEIDRFKDKGIYALTVYSVESIYYHPNIQLKIADRLVAVTGQNPNDLIHAARKAGIAAIESQVLRLSQRAVEKTLRDELDKHWPKQKDILLGEPINISIDVAAFVKNEVTVLERAINDQNLEIIVSRYPVRETPALTEISKKLGFQNCDQYENAVRKLIMDDPETLIFVQSQFGTLAADLING